MTISMQGVRDQNEKRDVVNNNTDNRSEGGQSASIRCFHNGTDQDLFLARRCFLIYGVVVTLLGMVVPIKEALGDDTAHGEFIEAFHMVLFICSITFLAYLQVYLLPAQKKAQTGDVEKNDAVSYNNSACTTEDEKNDVSLTYANGHLPQDTHIHKGSDRRSSIKSTCRINKLPLSRELSTDTTVSSVTVEDGIGEVTLKRIKGSNFYLRLGAVGFGVGGMIYNGLNLTAHILHPESRCGSVLAPYDDVLHMVFNFLQTYFIFKNSQACITKQQTLVFFGLVHIMATNMCVWLRTIIMDAIEAIYHHTEHEHGSNHTTSDDHSLMNGNAGRETCFKNTPGYIKTASPYLFPCIIEYSLISASVIYRVASHVGYKPIVITPQEAAEENEATNEADATLPVHHGVFSYAQCEKANKGVFAGLIILVSTIVVSILFFMFLQHGDSPDWDLAMTTVDTYQIILLVMMIASILVCFYRMTGMRSIKSDDDFIEGVVLVVAFSGLVMYNMFTILAAFYRINEHRTVSVLEGVSSLCSAIQGCLQTLFMLKYLMKRASTRHHVEEKPGRGMVTFLILCNVALWGINTFLEKESNANLIEREFYGPVAWNLIGHISLPLYIYYRFHSSAILAEIWHEAFHDCKTP